MERIEEFEKQSCIKKICRSQKARQKLSFKANKVILTGLKIATLKGKETG